MAVTDAMPSSQVDPQLLLRLLGLAAQRATGTPQGPGTPTPAGMTQAKTNAAPDATAAATTGTDPQSGPRNASPFGMTRGFADQTAPANGTPARPQNAAPAGMTRSQSSEARTPLGGVVATGSQPTPQNPASPNAPNPDKPDASAMALNKTDAAGEPGNSLANPSALSESEYDRRHPIAPNPNPYQQPGIIPRLMAGLSGAFATLGGNRAAGQAILDRYERVQKIRQDYRAYRTAQKHGRK